LGDSNVIRPAKKMGVGLLVMTICTYYSCGYHHHLHHPWLQQIQNGDILIPVNPDPPGKMAVKPQREREFILL